MTLESAGRSKQKQKNLKIQRKINSKRKLSTNKAIQRKNKKQNKKYAT